MDRFALPLRSGLSLSRCGGVGSGRADEAFLTSEFRTRRYAFTFDPDQLSAPFEKPVLILTGRQDGIAGYQDAWQLLANYPQAAYAVLDKPSRCRA